MQVNLVKKYKHMRTHTHTLNIYTSDKTAKFKLKLPGKNEDLLT